MPQQRQSASGKADVKQHFKATRLCKFNLAGSCNRGEACNFAHSRDQLSVLPDFSKTRLCQDFQKAGQCMKGAACNFAHGKEEMRAAAHKRKAAAEQKQASMMGAEAVPFMMAQPAVPSSLWQGPPGQITLMPCLFRAMPPNSFIDVALELNQSQSSEILGDFDRQLSMSSNSTNTTAPGTPCMSSRATEASDVESNDPDELFEQVLRQNPALRGPLPVKNTFIHVEPDAPAAMRRSKSAPADIQAWSFA